MYEKYVRVIIGYPRDNTVDSSVIASDTNTTGAMPGFLLGMPDSKRFKVQEDFVVPIGGVVGSQVDNVPAIIKISKTFKVMKKIFWPDSKNDSNDDYPTNSKFLP
jgi:hypothetical protein